MSTSRNVLGPGPRAEAGGIATLVRAHEVAVVHAVGTGWLREVAAYCDREGYRVRTLSTPNTVYNDLQGPRVGAVASNHRFARSSGQPDDQVHTPERSMLGRIGRLDLLARS